MLFGAHVSASGGVSNAPKNAAALGLECFQFFSRPPQGGRVGPLDPAEITAFLKACDEHGLEHWYIHAPYVINLASKETRIRESSIGLLRGELDRGSLLKTYAVMFHPGSASGVGEEEGMKLVIEGVKKILHGYKGTTRFLVEISAGAGMVIGDTFEEVAAILDGVDDERLGVCFDTAHAFASGYDLRTPEAVAKTMKAFDKAIGLERLEMSHCNDSKVGLGDRRDRHEHIGKGMIGLDGFRAIVGSPAFKKVNLILETNPDEVAQDLETLHRLRGKK
ncbi:MAG TPA: deoxyribonuclease IV [Candidatus Binatia bacterium]|jgi:deoxyribonuclease-4|nr:deoxyribonuclease IV [Candidatus Binatia bacterium]